MADSKSVSLARPLPVYFYVMTNPLKQVYRKAVKMFKNPSKCKPAGEGEVAGLVRHRGKLYFITVSEADETNFWVPVPKDGKGE